LPDSVGFGTHVLALARSPDGELWVGTYGKGIYVLPVDTASAAPVRGRTPAAATAQRTPASWRRILSKANDSTSISWNFVNSFGFPVDSTTVWYGTIGNGFGRSRDGGQTWRNWTLAQLGPEWQYVAPDGIRTRGDTVYIATADGLRITWDDGETWRCIQAADRVSGGAAPRNDACGERIQSLPSDYLLALDVGPEGDLWVGHLKGVSMS
jgi:hypothetical protein